MLFIITNRKLCKDDFVNRIVQLAKGKPDAIVLREKDLSQWEYEELALKVKAICEESGVLFIVHQNIGIAKKLGVSGIHLSMADLRLNHDKLGCFTLVGASVHTVEEAMEAQSMGATYLIAGHIFPTACKKDLQPRGLSFLKSVCEAVSIPVLAIGGINFENISEVRKMGAKGSCIMSEAMTCENLQGFSEWL